MIFRNSDIRDLIALTANSLEDEFDDISAMCDGYKDPKKLKVPLKDLDGAKPHIHGKKNGLHYIFQVAGKPRDWNDKLKKWKALKRYTNIAGGFLMLVVLQEHEKALRQFMIKNEFHAKTLVV